MLKKRKNHVNVHYYRQHSTRMSKEVFKSIFDEFFLLEVKTWSKDHIFPDNALLLLDNVPGHPCAEELTTKCEGSTTMFLPPTCTTPIYTMHQRIIPFFQQNYKKNLPLRSYLRTCLYKKR